MTLLAPLALFTATLWAMGPVGLAGPTKYQAAILTVGIAAIALEWRFT